MVNRQVKVDGTKATNVVGIEHSSSQGSTFGNATIAVANTDANRNLFTPGGDVIIEKEDPDNPGTYVKKWSGEVIGKPSSVSKDNLTLEVEAETKASQLEYGKIRRPFIERNSKEMLERAIDKERVPGVSDVTLYDGASTTPITTNADNVELLSAGVGMSKVSGDSLYADFLDDRRYTFDFTFDLGSSSVPGRRLLRLLPRVIVNSDGGFFKALLIFVDEGGIGYKWTFDVPGGFAFKEREYPVEKAVTTDSPSDFDYSNLSDFGDFDTSYSPPTLSSNTLRFALYTPEYLPEPRGVAIDYLKATPFKVQDRNTGLSKNITVSGIQTTKRFNCSIFEMARSLAPEDGAAYFVDKDDVFNYIKSGEAIAPAKIDETDNSLNVIDVEVDRNYDVRNRVTVKGQGEIKAAFEDQSSIKFYNDEAPKEEPIVDPSLQNHEQLKRRARGFLSENAWDDGAITFTVANKRFNDVQRGQLIRVYWPTESIDGNFVINTIGSTEVGYTTISLTGNITL